MAQTGHFFKHVEKGLRAGTYERRRKFVTQIHADLVFQVCISFLRCLGTPVAPIRKILVHTGMPACLVPSWPEIMQICISFRPRSDLVLELTIPWTFWAVNFLSCVHLVFEALQTKKWSTSAFALLA